MHADRGGAGVRAVAVTEDQVTQLESWCDEFNEGLTKLSSFILPGGTVAAAHLHHARTVARRAERSAWLLAEAAAVNDCALRYLNRLSDLMCSSWPGSRTPTATFSGVPAASERATHEQLGQVDETAQPPQVDADHRSVGNVGTGTPLAGGGVTCMQHVEDRADDVACVTTAVDPSSRDVEQYRPDPFGRIL